MSLTVAGISWVTPLGSGINCVWERLLAGEKAPLEALNNEQNNTSYLVCRVPATALTSLPAHPRLRRASFISRFAAAAGLSAITDAKSSADPGRTALVFAISNGAVIYTRRFYADIVRSGAQSASPLLFPETVFNAPASHLAAILGICGATYTVVGDGAVGVLALKLAEDLIDSSDIDACLVVAAEELDPLVCEAYRRWRLLRDPRKGESARGMIVSEGAAAAFLTRTGDGVEIEKIEPGMNFFRRAEVAPKLQRIVSSLGEPIDFCVGSANGTFIDAAELSALPRALPLYSPKSALGDSVGASALWQLVVAVQTLRSGKLPGYPQPIRGRRAVVLACGLNQQVAGFAIRMPNKLPAAVAP